MPERQQGTGSQAPETWPHPTESQVGPHATWPGASPTGHHDDALRLGQPRQRLDERALRLWRLQEAISGVIVSAIVIAVAVVLIRFLDQDWWWPALIAVVIVAILTAWAILAPSVRYRRWRYEIREDEVDLQHGVINVVRQLVPMSRIQHVDTRRGPLQRRSGLATVVFYTAAGAMEIPELADDVASSVRNRIADLADVHDDL